MRNIYLLTALFCILVSIDYYGYNVFNKLEKKHKDILYLFMGLLGTYSIYCMENKQIERSQLNNVF